MKCREGHASTITVCKGQAGDEAAFNCPWPYRSYEVPLPDALSQDRAVIVCGTLYRGEIPTSLRELDALTRQIANTPEVLVPMMFLAGLAAGLLLARWRTGR